MVDASHTPCGINTLPLLNPLAPESFPASVIAFPIASELSGSTKALVTDVVAAFASVIVEVPEPETIVVMRAWAVTLDGGVAGQIAGAEVQVFVSAPLSMIPQTFPAVYPAH